MKNKIEKIVVDFYQRIVGDFMIGYHFRRVDMKDHLPRIISFWKIQILNEKISVNPAFNLIASHAPMGIKEGEVGRFVVLFHSVLDEFSRGHPEDKTLIEKWKKKLLFFEEKFLKNLLDS